VTKRWRGLTIFFAVMFTLVAMSAAGLFVAAQFVHHKPLHKDLIAAGLVVAILGGIFGLITASLHDQDSEEWNKLHGFVEDEEKKP